MIALSIYNVRLREKENRRLRTSTKNSREKFLSMSKKQSMWLNFCQCLLCMYGKMDEWYASGDDVLRCKSNSKSNKQKFYMWMIVFMANPYDDWSIMKVSLITTNTKIILHYHALNYFETNEWAFFSLSSQKKKKKDVHVHFMQK